MNHSFSEPQPFEPHPLQPARHAEPSQNKQISADYYLKLGNRHYNNYLTRSLKRDLDLAIDHYRQALEMNPNLAEAYVKMASALWDKGGIPLETAIDYCQKALSLNEASSEAHLFLGYFLRKAGKLEEAMDEFTRAIRTAGKTAPAKAKMALGRVKIQKASLGFELPVLDRLALTADGIREFAAGCLMLPGDRNAFQVLKGALLADASIFALLGLGRTCKTVGLRGLTVKLYEWATVRMPNEPIFFHLLGDLYSEKKKVDAAIYYYNRTQELEPDNIAVHKKLGKAYSQCNDSANAARSLEKVVEAEAHDFDTMYMLAQIYTERHEYIRSLYYFKELVLLAPENPYIHSNMAYILFKLEDYDGAIQEYQAAVNFGEDPIWTATVAQTLGTIYYQIKQDHDAAVAMFQLAFELDDTNLDCLTMLGDIYTEQGNYEAAINAYRHIISHEPDNADCYNYLGYLLWQLDKNDEAILAYEKAIRLNPDNPIAYNNMGVIFLDEKCLPLKALEMFSRAYALKGDYTLACFNVGRTYEAMGRIAEAAKTYTEALNLNAENTELGDEEILERLERLFET